MVSIFDKESGVEYYSREKLIDKMKFTITESGCHETTMKNSRMSIDIAPSILLDEKYAKPGSDRPSRSKRKSYKDTLIRLIYELNNSKIPEGMEVFAECKNIKCIHPEHLILKSRKERGKENRKPFPHIYVKEDIFNRLQKNIHINLLKVYAGEPCHEVTAGIVDDGYARIHLTEEEPFVDDEGKEHRRHISTSAHRFMYEYLVGPVPDGLQLDHLCRNRCCCNIKHLEPVTQAENVARGLLPIYNEAKKHAPPLTHCKYGHPMEGDNVRIYNKSRRCRECYRQHSEKQRDKKNPGRVRKPRK
jgi:hypothetical protein